MRRDIQERTYRFALEVVALYRDLGRGDGAARTLRHQLLRSGTSVGANMEEADAAHSKADFISKCRIALKEARETLYWLQLLRDSGEASFERIEPLRSEANEIVSILTAIVKNSTAVTRHSEF